MVNCATSCAIDQRLNGNFSLLKSIIEEGETISPINPSFPLEQLLNRENFVSLLYYFGLLSMAGTRDSKPLLRISQPHCQRLDVWLPA